MDGHWQQPSSNQLPSLINNNVNPSNNLSSLFYNIQEDNIHVNSQTIPIHIQVLTRVIILYILSSISVYIHCHIMPMCQERNNKLIIIIIIFYHPINSYRLYFTHHWSNHIHYVNQEKVIILVVYQHFL